MFVCWPRCRPSLSLSLSLSHLNFVFVFALVHLLHRHQHTHTQVRLTDRKRKMQTNQQCIQANKLLVVTPTTTTTTATCWPGRGKKLHHLTNVNQLLTSWPLIGDDHRVESCSRRSSSSSSPSHTVSVSRIYMPSRLVEGSLVKGECAKIILLSCLLFSHCVLATF